VGQKVNPHGFRLGITTDHKSRWFADSTKSGQRYRDYVKEDVAIRKLMSKGMERAGIAPGTGFGWTSTPPGRGS
jgi:small subunit ribosomal protein S3